MRRSHEDIGNLVDVRYHMGSTSWYVSAGGWKVYWFSGKEWEHLPMHKDVNDD